MRRPIGAAGLLISMTERQLYSRGGLQRGKLCVSKTPLGCGQVLTGIDKIRNEARRAESGAPPGKTNAQSVLGRSFHISALHLATTMEPNRQAPAMRMKTPIYHRGPPTRNRPSRGYWSQEHPQGPRASRRFAVQGLSSQTRSSGIPSTRSFPTEERCFQRPHIGGDGRESRGDDQPKIPGV